MNHFLYNIGISAYALAVRCASLRMSKARKMIRGQHHTPVVLRRRLGSRPGCIWIHASSLGEFEQARPMIERLRREQPDRPILVSFFSPSGYEVRKGFPLVDAVVYLPFDQPKKVRQFLDLARPSMAIFVKYEFWTNYLQELRRRSIPTYLISAIFRPGQRFFKPGGAFFRRTLQCFSHMYVQDEASRRLLEGVSLKRVTVAGDTRFDRVTDVMKSQVDIPGFPGFGAGYAIRFIAGSSWEADENIYIPWLNDHSEAAFIIAPHEFNETRLEALRNRFTNGRVLMLSEWTREIKAAGGTIPAKIANTRGIIVDSFGKLSSLYRFADIAYIGGGFGAGIHNLNEAAVYGIPVIFGPNHSKFKEAGDLMDCGGGFSVTDSCDFREIAAQLTGDTVALKRAGDAAGKYIRQNLGATDKIYADIFGDGPASECDA